MCFAGLFVAAVLGLVFLRPDWVGNAIFNLRGSSGIGYVDYIPEMGEAWDRAFAVLRARGAGQVEISCQDFPGDPGKFFRENADIIAAAGFSDPESLSGKDLDDWKVVEAAIIEFADLQKRQQADLVRPDKPGK